MGRNLVARQGKSRRRNGYWTTGEIARGTGYSPKTIAKLIDSGRLRGHTAGSRHRRVCVLDLISWLSQAGITWDEFEERATNGY